MLTFLRKIRKSLIESGAARKYILYAIGEVLLVMVGILLALQINNWNENRKQKLKSDAFATSLLSEINSNLLIIDRAYNGYIFEKQSTLRFYAMLNGPEAKNLTRDSLIIMTRSLGPISYLTLGKSSYEDLINSGNLENFSNSKLRELIIDMGREFEIVEKSMERSSLVWNDLASYYFNHGDVMETMRLMVNDSIPDFSFEIDSKAFVKNRDFSNLLARRLWRLDRGSVASERLMNKLKELKSELEKQLND